MKTKLPSVCLLFILALLTMAGKEKTDPAKENKITAEEKEIAAATKKFEESLKFERGEIKLKDGLATLKVPDGYRYLNPADTEKLLQAWGNPPSEKTLGMIFRTDVSPFSDNTWGVVLTYLEEGYVKDDEADKINYTDLLQEMKESTNENNAERVKAGYPKVELIGWATPPRYDKATHKLFWAKELKFGDDADHTLNYDVRVLGRRGVLSLNAVASTNQLQTVQNDMQTVMGFVEFNQGNRYGDFVSSTDKVAAFGIGALVAGKLAAKAGFFKLLIAALLAGKKFVVIALIAIGSFLARLFGRKKSEPEESLSITSEPEVETSAPAEADKTE